MKKLLFLSDLHICVPGETIIGLDTLARLETTLNAAMTAHPDAAALILLGDLTHHGHPDEYSALARILANVDIPVIPMLGNHDRRHAFLAQFPNTPQTPQGHIQQFRDIGHHRIITLDSLDGPPYATDHHTGKICADRMAFLDNALTTRNGRFAIVCIHHPPFETGIVGMDRIKLDDGADLLTLLARHGNMHLVCGHLHRTIAGSTLGVPWTVLKSPCHQGVLDLVSPNSSLSTDEASAYGLALLTDYGVIIHSEDVDTGAKVFGGYHAHDEAART